MLRDPDIPELIGDTQMFDYAEFTAEYTALDMPMLYNLARCYNGCVRLTSAVVRRCLWTSRPRFSIRRDAISDLTYDVLLYHGAPATR